MTLVPELRDALVLLNEYTDADAPAHVAGDDEETARRSGWWPRRSTEAGSGALVGGCGLRLDPGGERRGVLLDFRPRSASPAWKRAWRRTTSPPAGGRVGRVHRGGHRHRGRHRDGPVRPGGRAGMRKLTHVISAHRHLALSGEVGPG